jgi:hypothetical protein
MLGRLIKWAVDRVLGEGEWRLGTRTSLILFRHSGVNVLVQCGILYDVTRAPRTGHQLLRAAVIALWAAPDRGLERAPGIAGANDLFTDDWRRH